MKQSAILTDEEIQNAMMRYMEVRPAGVTEEELRAAVQMELEYVISCTTRAMAYRGEVDVLLKDGEVTFRKHEEVEHESLRYAH